MTAKNTRHENLRQLVQALDLWRISSEPEMVELLKTYAVELRAALAPFDPNAGTVEQHQHARLHGAWVDCNKATSDRAVADGLEVRIVYLPATPEK